jgi:hypothetical protein
MCCWSKSKVFAAALLTICNRHTEARNNPLTLTEVGRFFFFLIEASQECGFGHSLCPIAASVRSTQSSSGIRPNWRSATAIRVSHEGRSAYGRSTLDANELRSGFELGSSPEVHNVQ